MMPDPIDEEIALAREAERARTQAPLDPARRARLWATIERRRSAPAWRLSWRWVAPAAAVAAGLLVWFAVGPEQGSDAPTVLPPDHRAERPVKTPAKPEGTLALDEIFVAAAHVHLSVAPGVELWAEPGAHLMLSEPRKLELQGGAVLLGVDGQTEPMAVWTDELRIAALAARFSVERAPGRTVVSVERGRVEWAASADLGRGRTLTAGTSTTVEGRDASISQSAPRLWSPPPVQRARPKVRRDPETAHEPAPELEVDVAALMASADAQRRAGDRAGALETYGRAASSASVGPLLEEALLRQAQLSAELDRPPDGLRLLEEIDRRVGEGLLGPERSALRAELHLSRDRVAEAASALEANPAGALVLDRVRLRVAERLLAVDPQRAKALLEIVLRGSAPRSIVEEARRLMSQAEDR